MQLDSLDVRILNQLQKNVSLPLRSLAELVHASPATCQRRIAQLKAAKIITKEVAIVDRLMTGHTLTVFVSIELEKQNEALLRSFEKKIAAQPNVLACYEVSGEFDFLLLVVATSMESYHAFTRKLCSSQNNVRNFKSTFALNCSKFETRIELLEPEA
jgi:Lrp/AsnC family transcriptional regulator, leucine-responsive regulatory protein